MRGGIYRKPSVSAEKRDVGIPLEVLTIEERDTWKPSISGEKRHIGNPLEVLTVEEWDRGKPPRSVDFWEEYHKEAL